MASNEPSVEQIALAIETFLMGMRREFVKRHGPEVECRVPVWRAMSSADKGVLMRSMRSALIAAGDPEMAAALRERRRARNEEGAI